LVDDMVGVVFIVVVSWSLMSDSSENVFDFLELFAKGDGLGVGTSSETSNKKLAFVNLVGFIFFLSLKINENSIYYTFTFL